MANILIQLRKNTFIEHINIPESVYDNSETYFHIIISPQPKVEVYKRIEDHKYSFQFEVVNFTNLPFGIFLTDVVGIKIPENYNINELNKIGGVKSKIGEPTKDSLGVKDYAEVSVVNGDSPEPKLDARHINWICSAHSVRGKILSIYKFMCGNGMYGKAEELISKYSIKITGNEVHVKGDELENKQLAVANITQCLDEFVEYLNKIAPLGSMFCEDNNGFLGFFNSNEE